MLQQMLAIALALWAAVGTFLAPTITFTNQPTEPPEGRISQANLYPDGTCTIDLFPAFYQMTRPGLQQETIDHEVGHCLGLQHVIGCSIMQSVPGCTDTPSVYDRAEWVRRHPADQSHIGMVVIP